MKKTIWFFTLVIKLILFLVIYYITKECITETIEIGFNVAGARAESLASLFAIIISLILSR